MSPDRVRMRALLTASTALVVVFAAQPVVAVAPLSTGIGGSTSAGAYPAGHDLPDFTHAGSPHFPYHTPWNGHRDRPVLVLYEYFDEYPTPPGKGEGWMARRIFGPDFPNLAGYFLENSFGVLELYPASEWAGTANNGVIKIASGPRADWDASNDGTRIRRALERADPFVDYSGFDADGSGAITLDELLILKVEVEPADDGTTIGVGGAAVRYTDDGPSLDGISLNGMPAGLENSTTNLITYAHETMHAALGMDRDWYQFGIDGFDVMGATAATVEFTVAVNSWHSMHMGWTYPSVVTRDGYYRVPTWADSGVSYLLYDPSKGAEHYFLVENRQTRFGSYDDDPAVLSGLNVWRIDETRYHEDDPSAFPIRRIRPCEGDAGCPGDWYFSTYDPADPDYPQRTMTDPWNDGASSRVAIRAIGPSASRMRVFFDVPGPGVLVDCFSYDTFDHRTRVFASRGAWNAVRLPIMNTGGSRASFDFTLTGVPAGWSVDTDLGRSLDGHASARSRIFVRPPSGTPSGIYTLKMRGRSVADPTVTSQCSFKVHIQG